MDTPPLVLALEDGIAADDALWNALARGDELRVARVSTRAAADELLAGGQCRAALASIHAASYPWHELLSSLQQQETAVPLVLLAGPADAELAIEAMRHAATNVIITSAGYEERTCAALRHAIDHQHGMCAQARARQQAELRTGKLSALAEISAAFSAVSLDYTSAIETVALKIAQTVDGLCTVLLTSDDGQWFEPVAVCHPRPQIQQMIKALMRLLRLPTNGPISQHVIQQGRPLLINDLSPADVSPTMAQVLHLYEEHQGASSLLVAPLRAQGRISGAVLVVRSRGPRLADELEFLQELADRAAITIAAAREHQAAQQEIAARAQAEEALRRREQLFRALVENSRDGIFRLDTGLRVVYANPQTLNLLECEYHEIIGRPCNQLGLPAQVAEQFAAAGLFVLTSCQEAVFTTEVASDDGSLCYHVRLHPEFAPDGAIESVLGIFRDITQLHRSQAQVAQLNRTLEERVHERTAALRASEARLQFLLSHTPAVIFTFRLSGDHRDSFISESVRDLLGYEQSEILSRPDFWQDQIHPEDRHLIAIGREQMLSTGLDINEYRFRHADGSYRWVQTGALLVRNEHSAPSEVVGYIVDISARREAEDALRHANAELSAANNELARTARLKDEFLASMSHELRTPLNAILGRAETLQEQIHGPLNERQLRSARSIEESGRLLLSLINDILDLSKIEAGRLDLNLMPVAIDALCHSTLRMMAQTASQRQITITSQIDQSLPRVTADERRLKQVLVNLLSNALKFTAEGGTVGLDVSRDAESGELRLVVWDTGIGIAEQDLQRLFQPFVQLDSRLSRKYNGSGLGLALVARMVALHGGRVWAESEPGRGSRFTVALPPGPAAEGGPAPPAEHSQAAPARRTPESEPGNPLILIADDNAENALVLQEYIVRHGYAVETASNGFEAVARSAEHLPALILMDIQMPGMDGLEAITHVRANPRTADIPIIALTALAMPGDRERCLSAGATDYLSKPVGLRDLLKTLQWHLGASRGK